MQVGLRERVLDALHMRHAVAIAAQQFVPATVDELLRCALGTGPISAGQCDRVQLEQHPAVLQFFHAAEVGVPELVTFRVRKHGPVAHGLHLEHQAQEHNRLTDEGQFEKHVVVAEGQYAFFLHQPLQFVVQVVLGRSVHFHIDALTPHFGAHLLQTAEDVYKRQR